MVPSYYDMVVLPQNCRTGNGLVLGCSFNLSVVRMQHCPPPHPLTPPAFAINSCAGECKGVWQGDQYSTELKDFPPPASPLCPNVVTCSPRVFHFSCYLGACLLKTRFSINMRDNIIALIKIDDGLSAKCPYYLGFIILYYAKSVRIILSFIRKVSLLFSALYAKMSLCYCFIMQSVRIV